MNCLPKYHFPRLLGLILLGILLVVSIAACGKSPETNQEKKSGKIVPETTDIANSSLHPGKQDASEEKTIKAQTEPVASKDQASQVDQAASKASASPALVTMASDITASETMASETKVTETTVDPLRPTSGQAKVNHQLLQVRGHIYVNMNYVAQGRENLTVAGTIQKQVGSLTDLDGDEQSTFGVGNPYQYLDRLHVVVKIDERWMIFQDLAINSWQIPFCVAHVTGTIQGREGNTVLFQVTQVPDAFASLFPEDPTKMKAIALPSQSFPTAALENPAFVGQTWEVWFDGDLQGTDPSLASPIHLGAVYQVCPVNPNKKRSKLLPQK